MAQSTIPKNHMEVSWHDYASASEGVAITEASLDEKASVIGRVGLMLLSCGTGAWRVRSSMNTLSKELGITCTADIGLMSIEYTCFDGESSFSQSLCLTNTGVNTSRLNRMEHFITDFATQGKLMSGEQLHSHLDEIERVHKLYSPLALGLAAALACGAFTFLLGGGLVEMICAFFGAGIGNFIRCKLTKHHYTLFLGIAASVSSACFVYALLLQLAEALFSVSLQHEAGYICSMLFIIPGFPFITSGIDLAKLDMRSGIERLSYAILIVAVAAVVAWIMALLLNLKPVNFPPLQLSLPEHVLFRLIASFCGVFGFSVMFNSSHRMAACAAVIGAISNTLRLELIDLAGIPSAAAAFLCAMTAGILASVVKNISGYPRISITVPAIVIMVPGLYLYRAIYNLGIMSLGVSASWFAQSILIILSLPLGLIFARIIMDKTFRYCT
ncbi:MAG: threonine/serine exporter family protein [Oscillospiraceae bacterium]|jgi:uncharacterized membrane protein YjjP (DUF1212 family)|nr:threonine/serine exporter family protein [Oscillospiraceae bacterium]